MTALLLAITLTAAVMAGTIRAGRTAVHARARRCAPAARPSTGSGVASHWYSVRGLP